MKKSTLALSALTLVLAAGLTACGGNSSYTIGGHVAGLQYDGLVLTNNGGSDLAVKPLAPATDGSIKNVSYAFPNKLDYGATYSVAVKSSPPHQTCIAYSGTADTAGRLTTIDAVISCGLNSYTIGGKITGLSTEGLQLTNGSGGGTLTITTPTSTDPVDFTFESAVTYNQTFGVTVLQQPTGQTCSVTNGAGVMADAAVTSIAVTCVNNPV